ncbi:UNVERIFIED_CONTAM: hypothetical protein PYX00_000853 [Menopon gallinae]|uniref:non-specific serine/threonine protein kinase n=1 Tax=Menopon gallinae TaxID=328185 RepID=A0AAW2IAP8_9NEOP
MANSVRGNPKYVYDLPYFERMELCRILDQNDKWEELGGTFMNFDVLTIQTLRREILRGNSPADELLTKWGHQNHTILELFVLLSKMQHYQAMLTIKQFVDPEYHRLIYEGEQNLSRLFQSRCPKNRLNAINANDQAAGEGNQAAHCRLAPPLEAKEYNVGSREDEHSHKPGSRQHGERNYEVKILNNEAQVHPGVMNPTKNSHGQTVLVNKQENAAAEPSDLLRPKLMKGESTKDKNISEISSIAESVGILPLITFKELEEATNGWDPSSILGKGGFGTVYKGTWKNTQVAIKRTKNSDTDENKTAQIQQILGELKMLNSYRHDNILPLYGFSLGAEEPCLIYQYLPNGSLEDRLLCRPC